jgi:hypothetical protein
MPISFTKISLFITNAYDSMTNEKEEGTRNMSCFPGQIPVRQEFIRLSETQDFTM